MASSRQNGKKNTSAPAAAVGSADTDHRLKAGERGPTVLEDFHLRVKITHFDHERIPERVVHARGAVTSSTDQLTAAVGLHRAWDRAPAVMASAVPPVLTS